MNSERIDANAETSFHSPHIDILEGVKLAAASSFRPRREALMNSAEKVARGGMASGNCKSELDVCAGGRPLGRGR